MIVNLTRVGSEHDPYCGLRTVTGTHRPFV